MTPQFEKQRRNRLNGKKTSRQTKKFLEEVEKTLILTKEDKEEIKEQLKNKS